MSDKNHEQYLEQIETAVAEITTEILDKHSGDLRAMAKVCAEKQVEINRLKEHQTDDRSTIRNLRAHFKEAVDEATELKDEIECRHSTWESREGEYEGEIEELKEENDELKKAKDYWSKSYFKIGEDWSKDIKEAQKDCEPLEKEIEKLKSQITKLQASEARLDQSTVGSMLSTTLADLS